MIHTLALAEIHKLTNHGIPQDQLTIDDIADLQTAALACDEAKAHDGLACKCARIVQIDDYLLAPMTCAGHDALERIQPWIGTDAIDGTLAIAWILYAGRNLKLLENSTSTRTHFQRTMEQFKRSLSVSYEEIASAVEIVLGNAEAGDNSESTEELTRAFSFHAFSARLAALTGVAQEQWLVATTDEALDAYSALMDFEAMKAGLNGSTIDRSIKDALRTLFKTTDKIARSHANKG